MALLLIEIESEIISNTNKKLLLLKIENTATSINNKIIF